MKIPSGQVVEVQGAQYMDDFIIGTEPAVVLKYPVAVQVISGSTVIMGHASSAKELLQFVLDLRPGEAINIVLTANNETDHTHQVAPQPRQVQHLCFEVDIGLSAVPCIYVRRHI